MTVRINDEITPHSRYARWSRIWEALCYTIENRALSKNDHEDYAPVCMGLFA
jgi:hypothetical protein